MAEQKTEQPTHKKLKDARKKGQVAKSNDLTQSLLFLTALGVLSIGGAAYIDVLREMMKGFFQKDILTGTLRPDEVLHRFGEAWIRPMIFLTPLFASLCLVSIAINFLQVQGLFAPEAVKPKFDKLNALKGFQNIFAKPRTYLELLKTLVKFSIVTALAWTVVRGSLRDLILTSRAAPTIIASFAIGLMFSLLFKIGAVFLFIGALDFMLQKKLYIKNLMMSKYEVQKEYKEEEGDPHVKHMRRQLHHQLLAQGMIQAVPKSQVVVVNPTHVAVALRYDEKSMNAPQVTAKGQSLMAQKIREIAQSSHVPILRNEALAHSLYEIEIDAEIPEDLYEAVAEVLNWVYQVSQAAQEHEA